MRRAIFLDRDGVVNVFPGADKFVTRWDEFHFMPDVAAQIRRLRTAGFFVVLITNQSGVGRGLMSLDDLQAIHRQMQQALAHDALDAIYFCPHHPNHGCACRKPSPNMILQACRDHGLDVHRSIMIGDSGRDMEMGRAAGCQTILCRAKLPNLEALAPQHRPDQMMQTLAQAVDWILTST